MSPEKNQILNIELLNLLTENNLAATFFIVGWIAKKYPNLV